MMLLHRCAIKGCPFEIPLSQLMCRGHWRLVPRPQQVEIYACFRKRRGGSAHVAAIKRATKYVEGTIAGWAKKNEEPAAPPYWDR